VADRRDLSIPVNLGFLAVLVVTSAFVAATPPDQTVDMASAEPPALEPPSSEPQPVTPPPASMPLRMTAVSMPPVPEMPDVEPVGQQPDPGPSPALDKPKSALSKPEPVAPDPATPAPARPQPATPMQVIPVPSQPVANLTPMAPSPGKPARNRPVQIMPVQKTTERPPLLAPLTASRHSQADLAPPVLVAMSAPQQTLPTGVSPAELSSDPAAPSAAESDAGSGADQLVESMPDLQPMKAEAMIDSQTNVSATAVAETAPQAVDWQVADRLMETAAQRLTLEFLWPADRQSHARIYAHLTSCLGVETGVVDTANRVHMGAGGGRSFNAALHSPFMRIVDRPVDPRERRDIERIRDRQQVGSDGGRAVRIFRRSHDMWLLAALNRAFGGLPPNGRVTAEYELDRGGLYLGKLTLDGRPHQGRISLDRDSCA